MPHQHRCPPSLFNTLSIWGLVVLVLVLAIACGRPRSATTAPAERTCMPSYNIDLRVWVWDGDDARVEMSVVNMTTGSSREYASPDWTKGDLDAAIGETFAEVRNTFDQV